MTGPLRCRRAAAESGGAGSGGVLALREGQPAARHLALRSALPLAAVRQDAVAPGALKSIMICEHCNSSHNVMYVSWMELMCYLVLKSSGALNS